MLLLHPVVTKNLFNRMIALLKIILLPSMTLVYFSQHVVPCWYMHMYLQTPNNSSPNYWNIEHYSIFIVTTSIAIHKEPNTIAAIVVSNNGILRGINHIGDTRIFFQDNSSCFLALLSHKLRPGKLTATYKCTSFGGLDLATN